MIRINWLKIRCLSQNPNISLCTNQLYNNICINILHFVQSCSINREQQTQFQLCNHHLALLYSMTAVPLYSPGLNQAVNSMYKIMLYFCHLAHLYGLKLASTGPMYTSFKWQRSVKMLSGLMHGIQSVMMFLLQKTDSHAQEIPLSDFLSVHLSIYRYIT